MAQSRFCSQCGAEVSLNAQFCRSCGKPIASAVPPTSPPPAAAAVMAPAAITPQSSNRGVLLAAAIGGLIVVCGCIAIGAFAFLYTQNQPPSIARLPISTPQIAATPTFIAPTSVPPSAAPTAQPPTSVPPSAAPTARPPTSAPTATLPPPSSTPASSPTPKCPPTPALPAGVLFSDDFASRQVTECNGWDIKIGDNSDDIWAPNQLTISQKRTLWVSVNHPDGQFADFAAETQAQPLGNHYAEYGLVFRDSGNANTDSFYIFGIDTDGQYELGKKIAGTWVSPGPVDWTDSPVIKPGAAQNTIGVIVQGGTISLYINRVLVKTFTDSAPLGKGNVGLMVASDDKDPAIATFSKLIILTPEKAKAEWSGASAPVSGSSQPEIVSLEFPSEILADGTKYDGLVRFRDAGGDIARISFDPAFIQPKGFNYGPFGFEFTNPAVRWVEGNAASTSGAFRFSNSCGGDMLVVTYAATLYDKAGNKSAPYLFTFLCKSIGANSLTVFFTIQNGSPTGYVIDKQGVKHAAPAYLTIPDLHIAPGDRIVLQTDQPRFSLLFDCGTSPQNFTPCDFVADTSAALPGWVTKNARGTAYLNISRADNWAGTRSGFPSQRYPADPVLRIAFGD